MDLEAQLDKARRIKDSHQRARALAALLRQSAEITNAILVARDEAARAMKAEGYTGREIMEVLGITKGRVSQLLSKSPPDDE